MKKLLIIVWLGLVFTNAQAAIEYRQVIITEDTLNEGMILICGDRYSTFNASTGTEIMLINCSSHPAASPSICEIIGDPAYIRCKVSM